jgi:flavin-binding protein dodecin
LPDHAAFAVPRPRLAETHGETVMSSIVKVIEVIAQSDKGLDDAIRSAVLEASKSVKGIRSVWVDNISAEVEGDRVTRFRVNAKLSFMVEGHQ